MYIVGLFSTLLCIFSIAHEGGGGPGTPTDLETSEVTQYSFRATWMPPDEPVERFRIEYVPLAGGKTEVVRLPECYWHGPLSYKEQFNQK